MTASLPRLVAMSLHRGATWNAFLRAVAEVDALLAREIDRGGHADGSLLAVLRRRPGIPPRASCATRSSPCSRPGTRRRPARSPGRSSGSPTTREAQERVRDGDDAYLDAVVKEVLRVRPVLSIAARRVAAPFEVGGHVLPPGVHVAPCIYLAHRRPGGVAGADRVPPRALPGRRAGAGHLPPVRRRGAPLRGRGVRRARAARGAAGGARALRARAGRARATERMIRGSVTLRPSRGGTVLTEPLQPSRPCRSSAATTA